MRMPLAADRGSVILLQVFCMVAVVMSIAVVCDTGAVLGVRRELSAVADQAAIAGAQAIDLTAYYRGGAHEVAGVPLDPRSAEAAVRAYLRPSLDAGAPAGLRLEQVEVTDDGVRVALSGRADLPFKILPGVDSAPVRASARASMFVQPSG
jgi:Putative Flp pilus-assembly TadE/G-like